MSGDVTAAVARLRATLAAEQEPRAGGIAVSKRDLRAVLAAVDAALALHKDGGGSQGYTDSGYGDLPHCCGSCGTFGEYGEEWPCATARALGATP